MQEDNIARAERRDGAPMTLREMIPKPGRRSLSWSMPSCAGSSGLAVYKELLTKHEMIKWEGESSKKPASIFTMLWYNEEEFFPRNQLVSPL